MPKGSDSLANRSGKNAEKERPQERGVLETIGKEKSEIDSFFNVKSKTFKEDNEESKVSIDFGIFASKKPQNDTIRMTTVEQFKEEIK